RSRPCLPLRAASPLPGCHCGGARVASPLTAAARRLQFFLSLLPPPPRPTLFPYTTLFRSQHSLAGTPHGRQPHHDQCRMVIDHRSEEHTSELQSQSNLVCRLLLEKKKSRSGATRSPWRGWRASGSISPRGLATTGPPASCP